MPLNTRRIARYGYRRDAKDNRDHIFTFDAKKRLPSKLDLSEHMPPPMDQGDIGSCTAHGITAALRFCLKKAGKDDAELSRLQLYYDERVIEGTVNSDAGAEIRDGIKTAAKLGVGLESLWPYDVSKFKRKPTKRTYASALEFQALTYQRVDVNARTLRAALATGFPVVIGITVFSAFESADVERTGVVPMPTLKDSPEGGHCMIACGYKPGFFLVRNSWGAEWGDGGNCWIPDGYLGSPKFGSDYWLISTVG